MKALKIVAFILGGLFAVAAAIAAFVVTTFDANRVKSEITRIVKDKKQRTLKLEGDFALSVWPGIGIRLGKTSLSEHNSDKEFAALDSAHVSLAVMPLLQKQVVVDRIELSGVKANLVRFKDGTLNVDDLLSKEKKDETQAVRFDIAGVKLDNAQISWRDEKSNQTLSLSNVRLDTGRIGNNAKGKLELAAKVTGEKPAANADIKFGGQYRYDLEQKDFAFDKLDAKIAGDIGGMRGLDVGLTAATLAVQAKGDIEIEKLVLAAKGKQGEDNFDVTIDAPKLSLAADKASSAALTVVAKLSGAQRHVDIKLNLSGIEGSSSALKVAKLALDLDAKQGDTAIKGAIGSPLAASFSAQTVELPGLAGELSVGHPLMPMASVKLPLNGSVRADWGKQSAAGELATRFDESSIRAKWSVPKFSPLALGFDVDIDRLNVDKYLPPKPASGKPAGAQKGDAGAEKPLDFSAIKGLDVNGTVKIGALQVSNVKASNVRLDIRANGGRLDINPLAANLYQGSLAGVLSVNANTNQIASKQTLAGVAINPLMRDTIDKDLLEGRGSVVLDVTTGGKTVTQLKKSLNGSASVNLKDGAIKGINLAKSFRELKSNVNLKQDAVRQASKTDKTDFSEMTASFRIANGVAHNDDLAAKSPFLRLAGAGDINIGEGSMNYLAKASVVGTSAGQEGKELAELKGVTVPVRVTGPFDTLSYKLEFANLVSDVAKAKVEEKKQELQQKAQERAKEQLKGLFKR